MAEDAQHVGELGDFRAAAAEFARHACLDEARCLERLVVLRDEAVALVRGGSPGGELLAKPPGDRGDILGHFVGLDLGHCGKIGVVWSWYVLHRRN